MISELVMGQREPAACIASPAALVVQIKHVSKFEPDRPGRGDWCPVTSEPEVAHIVQGATAAPGRFRPPGIHCPLLVECSSDVVPHRPGCLFLSSRLLRQP